LWIPLKGGGESRPKDRVKDRVTLWITLKYEFMGFIFIMLVQTNGKMMALFLEYLKDKK
jgi:hypothetical protein